MSLAGESGERLQEVFSTQSSDWTIVLAANCKSILWSDKGRLTRLPILNP